MIVKKENSFTKEEESYGSYPGDKRHTRTFRNVSPPAGAGGSRGCAFGLADSQSQRGGTNPARPDHPGHHLWRSENRLADAANAQNEALHGLDTDYCMYRGTARGAGAGGLFDLARHSRALQAV